VRILVVEDERRVRSFLERGLAEAGFSVDVAADGQAGLDLALVHPYDAIVLDLMLPKRDGLSVLRSLRAAGRAAPVLVLTARDEVDDRVRGLDAGADDYLPKPFAFAELLARLRALLRRGTSRPSLLEIGDLRVDLVARRAERAGRKLEFALLEYLARHAGEVVTRTMISEHVWDMNFDSFSNVIDVYIRYLRQKIDEPFAKKLIHTRRGIGYVLEARP
jgi:heavy metal response regulator